GDVETAIGIRTLRHNADETPRAGRIAHYVRPGDQCVARCRTNARRENADRGRLTGSIRSEKTEELSLGNSEIERVEGDDGRTRRHPALCGRRIVDLAESASFDGVHKM